MCEAKAQGWTGGGGQVVWGVVGWLGMWRKGRCGGCGWWVWGGKVGNKKQYRSRKGFQDADALVQGLSAAKKKHSIGHDYAMGCNDCEDGEDGLKTKRTRTH